MYHADGTVDEAPSEADGLGSTARRCEHAADVSLQRTQDIAGIKAVLMNSATTCIDAIEAYEEHVTAALLARQQSQRETLVRLMGTMLKALIVSKDAAAISALQAIGPVEWIECCGDGDADQLGAALLLCGLAQFPQAVCATAPFTVLCTLPAAVAPARLIEVSIPCCMSYYHYCIVACWTARACRLAALLAT